MKKLNNKGFSLVELIIVIAIMVILVAVLSPVFSKYVERGRKSTDIQSASEIATAVQTAMVDPFNDENVVTGVFDPDYLTDCGIDSVSVPPTVKAKTNSYRTSDTTYFVVQITDNKIEVFAGGTETAPGPKVFPDQADPYDAD